MTKELLRKKLQGKAESVQFVSSFYLKAICGDASARKHPRIFESPQHGQLLSHGFRNPQAEENATVYIRLPLKKYTGDFAQCIKL